METFEKMPVYPQLQNNYFVKSHNPCRALKQAISYNRFINGRPGVINV
jgi:hypothetical protein